MRRPRKPQPRQILITFDEPLYVALEAYEKKITERLGARDLLPTRSAILRSLLRRALKGTP